MISALGADDSGRGARAQGQPDKKDFICGGSESDGFSGDAGNDWIDGERGNDGLAGQDGQDHLFGGAGNDYLRAGPGSDFVDGGEGVDTIPLDSDGLTPRWTSDTFHGGEGGDFVGGTSEGSRYALFGSDSFYGDAGNDQIIGTRSQSIGEAPGAPDLVDGGPGKDTCWVDIDDTVVSCEEVIELPPCTTCEPGGPPRAAQTPIMRPV